MEVALGIDLGGTKVLARIEPVEAGSGPLEHRRVLATGADFGLADLLDLLPGFLGWARSFGCEPVVLGVGFPGLVDSAAGIARSSVILRRWQDVELGRHITASTGLPCAVDNDVNQIARAELRLRGDGARDMLVVAVGTGIGGAVVLDGRLWQGSHGLAGELGHVSVDRSGPACPCGRRGCVGVMSSGSAVEARLGLSAGELRERAQAGDPEVSRALREAGEILGVGLGSVLNVLDVSLVVFAGGMAEIGPDFREHAERSARREAFPEIAQAVRFEVARAGYDAGAVGAALSGRERLSSLQDVPASQPASAAISAS